MTKNISFGTSGHRGIIGEDFSIKHVQAIARAVADYLKKEKTNLHIAIGYDPRSGNSAELEKGSFTEVLTHTLMRQGISVDFFSEFMPTPVISDYVVNEGLGGALILTASHNPPNYNGLKFNPANGAPAPSDVTNTIEELANTYFEHDNGEGVKKFAPLPVKFKFVTNFEKKFVQNLLNNCFTYLELKTTDFKHLTLTADVKHGTAGIIWEKIFKLLNINYELINKTPLADFGGLEPNPTKSSTLEILRQTQQRLKAPLAFANDPDADRHVILDENGQILLPEETTTIILDFFITQKRPFLGVATTVASSRLIKTAVAQNNLVFWETPVGFKYFANYLEKGRLADKLVLAVESSGGFSTSFHTKEKCGFLPCLLLLGIIIKTQKSASQLKADIYKKYGATVFKEKEYRFAAKRKNEIITFIKNSTKKTLASVFGDIKEIVTIDGLKIILSNDDWILIRLSGTEPLARIYAESSTEQDSLSLISKAENVLG